MTKRKIKQEPSSFRDPSGFVFFRQGKVYRQIHQVYLPTFKKLEENDLLTNLIQANQIIPYETVSTKLAADSKGKKVIKPETLPFISYPYEWSFGQLKDSALLTLSIQKKALENDFSLKDASAFNIQFLKGKPVLIDHLSFEKYEKGKPWVAYQQFCRHFLAPLALMCYKDLQLNDLLKLSMDGIPLDLAQKLLPTKTKLNLGLFLHLHLHANSQKQYADKNSKTEIQTKQKKTLSKIQLLGLIDSLKNTIEGLKLPATTTEWGEYYTFTNYSQKAFIKKKEIISTWIKKITKPSKGQSAQKVKPETVWDLGGNTGEFSKLASEQNIFTVSFDIDSLAVEKNYQQVKKNQEQFLLPLRLDLTNPTPSLGWAHQERKSLAQRGPTNIVMALALIHHLAISNNLPFLQIAEFFQKLGEYLIIEFVPKTDSQVKKLLTTREDIFPHYTEKDFETEFKKYFQIIEKTKIGHQSKRTMYLMKATKPKQENKK